MIVDGDCGGNGQKQVELCWMSFSEPCPSRLHSQMGKTISDFSSPKHLAYPIPYTLYIPLLQSHNPSPISHGPTILNLALKKNKPQNLRSRIASETMNKPPNGSKQHDADQNNRIIIHGTNHGRIGIGETIKDIEEDDKQHR